MISDVIWHRLARIEEKLLTREVLRLARRQPARKTTRVDPRGDGADLAGVGMSPRRRRWRVRMCHDRLAEPT